MFVSEDDCHPSLNLHSFTNIGWSDQFVVQALLYYYWRNIFTAFAVGLSGYNKARFQEKLESFSSLLSIFGYLGKETKNTAEHVIMQEHPTRI